MRKAQGVAMSHELKVRSFGQPLLEHEPDDTRGIGCPYGEAELVLPFL